MFLALLLLGVFVHPARAENRSIRVPGEHATIMEAMGMAALGDTVLVGPGTYREVVVVKEGVVLLGEKGPSETTIVFDPENRDNPNEAAVSLLKCSNSTQLIGFTVDGGKSVDGSPVATRAVLVAREGSPVISNCSIRGALNGIGSHQNATPYILDTRVEGSQKAGIFIKFGSADIRRCELTGSEQYGLVVEGTTQPLRVRDVRISNNVHAGVRATDGEFTISGGVISGNGNAGVILEYVAPVLQGVRIEGNANIGLVLLNCTATILGCTIRNNDFGCAISGSGDPKIFRTIFEDNTSCHIRAEGDVVPIIGGSIENANLFLGATKTVILSACPAKINATYNYWGKPCATKDQIKRMPGAADVVRSPWVTSDLKHAFKSCQEARDHSRLPVGETDAETAAAGAETAPAGTETAIQ